MSTLNSYRLPYRAFLLTSAVSLVGFALMSFAGPAQAQGPAPQTTLEGTHSTAAFKTVTDQELTVVALFLKSIRLSEGIDAVDPGGGGGNLCLDLAQTAKALNFSITVEASGNAKGWFIRESNKFELDVTKREVRSQGQKIPVAATDLVLTPGGPCVDISALGRWLGLEFKYDEPNSLVTAFSSASLPIEQQKLREDRYAKLKYQNNQAEEKGVVHIPAYRLWRTPSVDVLTDISLNREGKSNTANAGKVDYNATVNVLASGEIARFSSEFLAQTNSKGKPDLVRLRAYRRDPGGKALGDFAGGLGLTEVALGDVVATSNNLISNGGIGRGITLSSFPLDAPDQFDRTQLRGDLPSGWDAELYRNNVLIGAVPANDTGRYEFTNIPILFGDNELKVVLYGPQGQRREEIRNISTGANGIPRGKIYGRLSVLQNEINLVELQSQKSRSLAYRGLRVDGALRAGLSASTSVGASIQGITRYGKTSWYGSSTLYTSFQRTALELTGFGQDNGAAAAQVYAQRTFEGLNFIGRYAWFSRQFDSDRIRTNQKARWEVTANGAVHAFKNVQIPFSVNVIGDSVYGAPSDLAIQQQIGATIGRFSVSNNLNFIHNGQSGTHSLSGAAAASYRGDAFSMRLQSNYLLGSQKRLSSVQLFLDRNEADERSWFYRLGASWAFADHLGAFSATASRQYNAMRLGARAEVDTDGTVAFGLTAAMSFGPPALDGQGWAITSLSQAQTGSVAAFIYEDRDSNGRFNEGDVPLPNINLRFNGHVTQNASSSRGMLMVQGLTPYSSTRLAIDEASLPDPDMIAAEPLVLVQARPGITEKIEFPIVLSGSIEGTVLMSRETGLGGVGGIAVRLMDSGGAVIATQTSDYDGFFAFDRVPAGVYLLDASYEQLDGLKLQLAVAQQISLSRAIPYVRGANLVITPVE